MNRPVSNALLVSLIVISTNGQPQAPRLQRLVDIRGEHGAVSFQADKLSLFSTGNISVTNWLNNGQQQLDAKVGVVTLELGADGWRRSESHLDVKSAYSPPMCDPLNQIDIGSTDTAIRQALPMGSKIKAIETINDGWFLVVYSTSKSAVRYDIQVALVRARRPSPRTATREDAITLATSSSFCGTRFVDHTRVAIIADEPAGSSDYLAIYVVTLVGTLDSSQ